MGILFKGVLFKGELEFCVREGGKRRERKKLSIGRVGVFFFMY